MKYIELLNYISVLIGSFLQFVWGLMLQTQIIFAPGVKLLKIIKLIKLIKLIIGRLIKKWKK